MSIDYDTAVGLIYEAALDPIKWHTALTAVAQLTGAHMFHLLGWNSEEQRDELGILTSSEWDGALAKYESHYGATDPRVAACAGLGAGRLMVCTEHFDARFVTRSEIYQDLLLPWGLRYSMASILGNDGALTVAIGLMRPADAGAWRDGNVTAARRLLPHLQRAALLVMRERAHREDAGFARTAAELTHLALITLTPLGRVLHANARGEALLRRQLGLRLHRGCLHACSADAQARLLGAIQVVVCSGRPQHLMLPAAGEACAATMTLMRAPATSPQDSSLRLVCIVAEGRARIATAAQLIDWFGLTPAEARLVRAPAHGGDLDGYAVDAGITRNTAKTQLARAMGKIGVGDQRELIRCVLRLHAVRG